LINKENFQECNKTRRKIMKKSTQTELDAIKETTDKKVAATTREANNHFGAAAFFHQQAEASRQAGHQPEAEKHDGNSRFNLYMGTQKQGEAQQIRMQGNRAWNDAATGGSQDLPTILAAHRAEQERVLETRFGGGSADPCCIQ
jgi:hypothetical protein